jgi:hypothetical protein
MKLKALRHRDKRYKRLHERTERYHQHKTLSVFAEHYENEPIGILPYIEDESFLQKRKPKRKRKRKNKK